MQTHRTEKSLKSCATKGYATNFIVGTFLKQVQIASMSALDFGRFAYCVWQRKGFIGDHSDVQKVYDKEGDAFSCNAISEMDFFTYSLNASTGKPKNVLFPLYTRYLLMFDQQKDEFYFCGTDFKFRFFS